MVGQVSTHSRPKAAGLRDRGLTRHRQRFQHTAARRRLEIIEIKIRIGAGFNTQPPEGGWTYYRDILGFEPVSTHSRLKAAG